MKKEKIQIFEDFLNLCQFYKNYSQRFTPTDLYKLNLLENQTIISIDEVIKLWEIFLNKNLKGKVNLFITTPFCIKKCNYCQYFKYELKNQSELEEYKNNFISQIEYFSTILKRIKFANLRFGGSTPSLFNENQLENIFSTLNKYVFIDSKGEKTFECNPYTITLEKLQIARKYGFNRISLGVQSFNLKILKVIGRDYQKEWMVKQSVDFSRQAGFDYINIDLIMGINGETPKDFAKSFEKALNLNPVSVFIYELTPDKEYLDNFYNGDIDKFFKYIKKFEKELYPLLIKISERKRYLYPSESVFMLSNKINGAAQFTRESGDVPNYYSIGDIKSKDAYLGLGYQSDLYIPDIAEYQTLPLTQNPKNNKFKAVIFNNRSAMEYYVLNRISTYHSIDYGDFKIGFHKDFKKVFGKEISEIVSNKLGKTDNNKLLLNKDNMKIRFLTSLFFIEFDRIINLINKWLSAEKLPVFLNGRIFYLKLGYSKNGDLCINFSDSKNYINNKLEKIIKKLNYMLLKEKNIINKIILVRKFSQILLKKIL